MESGAGQLMPRNIDLDVCILVPTGTSGIPCFVEVIGWVRSQNVNVALVAHEGVSGIYLEIGGPSEPLQEARVKALALAPLL